PPQKKEIEKTDPSGPTVSIKQYALSGTVYRDKVPLGQAEVLLYILEPIKLKPISLLSNEQGQFRFENLKPGTYQLRASYGHEWACLSDLLSLSKNLQIPLHLQGTAQVYGQVVDEKNRPLSEVQISILASPQTQVIPDAQVKSDVDGKFAFSSLPKGHYVLYCQKSGFCSQIVPDLESRSNRLIQMFPGGILRGKIIRKEDKISIPMARIEALNQNWIEHFLAEESGLFQIEGVPEGTFQLRVEAPGFLPLTLSFPIKQGETLNKEIELERGFELKGRVLDANHQPVPLAKVSVLRESIVDILTERTNERGEFIIQGLPGANPVFLKVSKEGYTQSLEEMNQPIFIKTDHQSPTEVTLTLKSSPTLQGTVINARGQGVSGAKLTLISQSVLSSETSKPVCSTEASGQFEWISVTAGNYQVQIEHPEYAPYQSEPFSISGNESRLEKKFTLETGHLLKGVVFGPEGDWISTYDIQLFSLSLTAGLMTEPALLQKGDSGRFTIGPVASSSKLLQINAKGYAFFQKEIALTEFSSEIEVHLQKGEPIAGIVQDSVGQPIPNVTLYTLFQQKRFLALSDAKGHFEIADLPPGHYVLYAYKEGFSSLEENIETPQENLELRLIQVMTLRGVISSGNLPVERFSIHFWGDTLAEQSHDIHSEDGTFFLENVPNIPLYLEIRAIGFSPYYLGPLTPTQLGDLEIKLKAGMLVAGRVETADGNPLGGVTIVRGKQTDDFEESSPDGRSKVLGWTEEDGLFSLPSFGSQSETITFLQAQYAPTYIQITPPVENLVVKMSGGCTLSIFVRNANYQPLPEVGLVITGPVTRRTETGPEGSAIISRLISGEYQVEVLSSSRSEYKVVVQAEVQNTLEIILR
ncbi:MAG: carboxypeptidase-like regulatory domain-containing protein, partial [Planctomycetota bacterium]